jgi:hypothetical protein
VSQESLFQFTGHRLVRNFGFDRSGEVARLILMIRAQEGRARLLLINPEPLEDLFAIIWADELWIYADEPEGEPGRIKVEFWVDGFCQFTADSVVDLDKNGYETDPGSADLDYRTGPIPGEDR